MGSEVSSQTLDMFVQVGMGGRLLARDSATPACFDLSRSLLSTLLGWTARRLFSFSVTSCAPSPCQLQGSELELEVSRT